MLNVRVKGGNIAALPANGLITAINSDGMWFGGIDGAIQGVAGPMFHMQAERRMPLSDGEVVFAPALDGHAGLFGSVIFVVDDLQQPLQEIVLAGLQEAERQHLATVTLPSLRTGVMCGVYEPTVEAALDQTVTAIERFREAQPQHVTQLTVVVFNDVPSERYLAERLVTV